MITLVQNPDRKEYYIQGKQSQIDLFQKKQHTLTIHLSIETSFLYAVFLDDSILDITITTEKNVDSSEHSSIQGQIFAFIPAKSSSTSSLTVNTVLQTSGAEIKVHLIAIQDEQATVTLQGAISIMENVENVSGHLLEEVVLLGNSSYTSLKPILNVSSPDVQASHGAKVHRISADKLFYMQSKGLPIGTATGMMIDSYVQQIL